ncbi:MmgE/PrpD family protein [Chelatococcus reniformis]|uniref:MmgE/PrpD family protein n=1 Tax=Chelatococcus reniformis TaxID=1494448 RepID=A0A916UGD7_9HYPH|nr:MmgE/PrpD family protein [Chelatococcus reniformis]GGC69957.1 hypothetical protein GCM10010994_30680 [Chelatococcus reniformis]
MNLQARPDERTAPTSAIAAAAVALRFEHLPEHVVTLAGQCLLDWIGVSIAAADEPAVRILVEQAREEGALPRASLAGHNGKVSTRQAALINGAASHALDFDDVNVTMVGHPTVAVMPSVLALAEARGATGADVVAGFVAGYEAACRVGHMVSPGHYARGFHVTATVGSLGSAAGCSNLLRLSSQQTAQALGIAATQAAGLKSMFGTMCKPFHAGKANENGLLAAQLAARGFESRADVIECEQGFAATQSSDFAPDRIWPPGAFHITENLFKYHASCYQTHAAIEALRAIKDAHGLQPADVAGIVLMHDAGADTVCNIHEPRSGLEAKFSLRILAAFALAGIDTARAENFSEENVTAPELVALRERVEVRFTPDWPITRSEAAVLLKDGRTLTAAHDSGIPDADLARQEARLSAKFMSLVEPRLGRDRAARLAELALKVGSLQSLDEMMSLMSAQ